MIRQFVMPAELQQFLSGVNSLALTNVLWDQSFLASAPVLPLSPDAVRRALYFSAIDTTTSTPVEYDVFIENVDGTSEEQLTVPR